jgi:hypothetical protein
MATTKSITRVFYFPPPYSLNVIVPALRDWQSPVSSKKTCGWLLVPLVSSFGIRGSPLPELVARCLPLTFGLLACAIPRRPKFCESLHSKFFLSTT